MTPEYLSKKLCSMLNLDLPDILNPRQNEGQVLTIKCSEKAFKRFLTSFDYLITNYVPIEERPKFLVEGWINEKLIEQLPQNNQHTVPQSQDELNAFLSKRGKQ